MNAFAFAFNQPEVMINKSARKFDAGGVLIDELSRQFVRDIWSRMKPFQTAECKAALLGDGGAPLQLVGATLLTLKRSRQFQGTSPFARGG